MACDERRILLAEHDAMRPSSSPSSSCGAGIIGSRGASFTRQHERVSQQRSRYGGRIGALLGWGVALIGQLCVNEIVPVAALADLKPEDFASGSVTVLNSETFEDFVTSNKHALVQFYAPWCGHCKQFRHEFLKAAEKLGERGILVK